MVNNSFRILNRIVKKPKSFRVFEDFSISSVEDFELLKEDFRVSLSCRFDDFIFLDRPSHFAYKCDNVDGDISHRVVIRLDSKEHESYILLQYVFKDGKDLDLLLDNLKHKLSVEKV